MPKLSHFLTGEELSPFQVGALLNLAEVLKTDRHHGIPRTELAGKSLALLFEKPSFRTRLSFSVGMQELGGFVVESQASQRKKEDPEELAGVLNGYCHGIVLRTFEQSQLDRMCEVAKIPVINGLSDLHHPCQILADLLALKQTYQDLQDVKLTYIGDGNNILHSLLILAPRVGIDLRYACPENFKPNTELLERAVAASQGFTGSITEFSSPVDAVSGTHAIYTDVWTSMGFEKETAVREDAFQGYQLNSELYAHAAPGAVILHCLPMEKEKEITAEMANHPNSVIFRQSENRLHVQKAILLNLLAG
jgi:ornithine carbamoyltransferase